MIKVWAMTDTGLVRSQNQDAYGVEHMPELEAGAERWATERGGRSPRCARQFIRAAEAKIKRGQPV